MISIVFYLLFLYLCTGIKENNGNTVFPLFCPNPVFFRLYFGFEIFLFFFCVCVIDCIPFIFFVEQISLFVRLTIERLNYFNRCLFIYLFFYVSLRCLCFSSFLLLLYLMLLSNGFVRFVGLIYCQRKKPRENC